MKRIGRVRIGLLTAVLVVLGSVSAIHAQSTQQEFPTPIVSNEISGQIVTRAIGDPRPTTYYYYFNGDQGDIFVNLVTDNFAGDVDVFIAEGQRLLTRIVVLADTEPSETGRVVYLRKPERLLIRIQGRTPNDDPATFRIKFAGSFLAVKESEAQAVPELPTVPKPAPDAGRVAEAKPVKREAVPEKPVDIAEAKPVAEAPKPTGVKAEANPEPTVVEPEPKTPTRRERRTARRERETPKPAETRTAEKPAEKAPEKPADPVANFRLVVIFKDGSKIERPMTEVLRFTVDRGMLTVISKDGRIGRYSMADVQRVGIE